MDNTANKIKEQLTAIEDTSTRLQRLMRTPLEVKENQEESPSSTLSLAYQVGSLSILGVRRSYETDYGPD